MKKIAILSLLAFALLNPAGAMAQKKGKKTKDKKNTTATIAPTRIETSSDSISYAFGASITEGLPQYLSQMNVLIDTAAIRAEVSKQIANETDIAKKADLEAILKFKLDSANRANDASMAKFIEGFEKTFNNQNNTDGAYNAGVNIANQTNDMIKNFSNEVLGEEGSFNRDLFVQAFIGKLKKEESLIDNPQGLIQKKAQEAQMEKQKLEAGKMKAEYAEQIAAGEKFMAENKTKPGVVALPSGLQYKIITEGNGPIPKIHDKVKVHYHGTLLDGTVFDSSVERGEPLDLTIGQLITGWNEALTMMPAGSKWILYIPYNLAYGERNMGVIKPFSDLIFEVELISIVQTAEEQAQSK
jgi:FKBP-type peptidyl-prolyl cis-trans isomerase FklB